MFNGESYTLVRAKTMGIIAQYYALTIRMERIFTFSEYTL